MRLFDIDDSQYIAGEFHSEGGELFTDDTRQPASS
jgi:hypothetical protein